MLFELALKLYLRFQIDSQSLNKLKNRDNFNNAVVISPSSKLSSTIIHEPTITPLQQESTVNATLMPNSPVLLSEDLSNNSLNLSNVVGAGNNDGGSIVLFWEEKQFLIHDLMNSLSKYERHVLEYYR